MEKRYNSKHKKDYIWNPRIYACECNKKCKIDEYSNTCTCIKHAVDNLIMLCKDKMLNIAINSDIKKQYIFNIIFC